MFFHSAHQDSKQPSIPRVVKLDHGEDEEVSTIYEPHQHSKADGNLFLYNIRQESEYQDLQMVIEDLELELKGELSRDDGTASLEIIMGPKPSHQRPPSQTSSFRSMTSSDQSSSPKSLPLPPSPLKAVTEEAESNKYTKKLAPSFDRKQEVTDDRFTSTENSPHVTIDVSSSSGFMYSASHSGSNDDDTNESCGDDGSSYSSCCRRLLGDTTKQGFDFSSVYQHRYHPHPRHHNHALSFQTSSTDTTMKTRNRKCARVRSAFSGILAH
jgi:hypothetical protein